MKIKDVIEDLLNEQSFYPKGCRPLDRIDPHGQEYNKESINKIKKDFKYSTSKYWINKFLEDYKKKDRSDKEYKNAKEDLWNSMDDASKTIYKKLASEKHPLYYGLVALFAQNAKSAIESFRPSGYKSLSAKRVDDYKVKLKNWVTTLNDLGNDDYQFTFNFDRVYNIVGVN